MQPPVPSSRSLAASEAHAGERGSIRLIETETETAGLQPALLERRVQIPLERLSGNFEEVFVHRAKRFAGCKISENGSGFGESLRKTQRPNSLTASRKRGFGSYLKKQSKNPNQFRDKQKSQSVKCKKKDEIRQVDFAFFGRRNTRVG